MLAVLILVVAAAYYGAGAFSLALYPASNGLAGIWPAAGVAVAAVLILGPLASLGVLAGDLFVGLYAGLPLAPALVSALASAGESLLAWYLLSRVCPIDTRLARVRDVAAFIGLGVVLNAVLCFAVRLLLQSATGDAGASSSIDLLAAAALGHGLGVLVVAPAVLTWRARASMPRPAIELLLLTLATVLINIGAFSASLLSPGSPLLYAVYIVVLWAALRFGPRETSLVLLATALFAMWAAGRGSGPFLLASPSEALSSLGVFLMVSATTALLLAAAVYEKQALDRRVAESEVVHRTLIEQMGEGVVMIDALGRLNYVSDRFCEICGRQRERLLGSPLADIFTATDREALQAAVAESDTRMETVLVPPSGQALTVSLALRRLAGAAGDQAVTLAVLSDVTEQRRAEERARLHLQQLAHMGRLKSMDEMAIALAHEITQPLTAIMSYTQAGRRLLGAGHGDDPALAEALAGANGEARRARVIVQRIRNFVQNRPARPANIEAAFLIAEAVRFAGPEARQHSIDLRTEAAGAPCSVHADPIQIQQVLLNLVQNAVEAIAEAASPSRRVTVSARQIGEGFVEFAVEDSGPGIPPAHLDRVFEPFFTTKETGVGIGLALCHSIVDAHGGRIRAEPRSDGGAAIRFTLPASSDGTRTPA
ncbi:MAG: MASE1 domain-containing protein [Rhodocyclales bacterium]|nr:MASE1 domain-containing protein [Rhodocyclales bacterium]